MNKIILNMIDKVQNNSLIIDTYVTEKENKQKKRQKDTYKINNIK